MAEAHHYTQFVKVKGGDPATKHWNNLLDRKTVRTGEATVRLNAWLQASAMQRTPRNVRIKVSLR
ncbi:hypothetical protein ABH977_008283 [Bradyrhizobium ottawaense]